MISFERVGCSSRLVDSCGIVFEYEGRILRALTERGRHIVDFINAKTDREKLASLGFLIPRETELTLPGYSGVVEVDRLHPLIPPSMWNLDVTVSACQTLCRLNREFLKSGYVLWDLGSRDNMAFNAARGTVFVDMGALHSTEELEHRALSTSFESLFSQFVDSFYIPIWLSLSRFRSQPKIAQLLNYSRIEPRNGPAKAILRRLLLGGRVIPGWYKARRLIQLRKLNEFYSFVESQVSDWYERRLRTEFTEGGATEPTAFCAQLPTLVQELNVKTVFHLNSTSESSDCRRNDTDAELYDLTGNADWPALSPPHCGHTLACDIWDRSLNDARILQGKCDLVMCGPNIVQLADHRRIPLDFIGKVLSVLTSQWAVVGVGHQDCSRWPAVVSPPQGVGAVDFVRRVIGKYFGSSEVVESPNLPNSIIRFRKSGSCQTGNNVNSSQ